MAKNGRRGIFCVEGAWGPKLTNKSTVRPLLEVLDGQNQLRFIHRDAATVEEFEHYLSKWTQKQYASYDLGYLAFHGHAGGLLVGQTDYSLDRLGELLEGRLEGRILHFGTCKTLSLDREEAERFRTATRARAICGYTRDVDWIESAAFDLNLFQLVAGSERIDTGFKALQRNHGGACERLGLRAMWRTGAIWP